MDYTNLRDFYNNQYADQIKSNPDDYNFDKLSSGAMSFLSKQALGSLADNKVYKLGDTNGLDGYQNQFLKQGNQFIPIVGDASQYGPATQLDIGTGTIMQNGYGIRPLDYAIKGGQTLDQSNSAYNNALNDSTTNRVTFSQNPDGSVNQNGGTVISGQQALDQQAAARNAMTDTTSQPGYTPTAQDKFIQDQLAKGIPIGLANAPQQQPTFVSSYKGSSIVDFLNSVKQDSSFANRAKLAAQNGITGYKGTADQNLQLLAKLRGATTGTPATEPTVTTSGVTADNLQKTTNATVPGTTTSAGSADASAIVAGGTTTLSSIIQQLTPPETEADKKQQSILDSMLSLNGQEAQKAADQLTQEQAAGLPQLRQQFANINGQIVTKTAEYNALQADQEGKPVTMDTIIGSTRQILNAKAADIGLLTAQAQALQGQITTAQDTVNRAIDLKYSAITAQLQVYQAQLNALQPELTKEEKIQAEAQQLLIEQQKQAVEDAKQTAKDINGVMLDAAKAGLTDTKVLNQISSAKTLAEAQTIAAPYLAKAGQLDNALKQSEINKNNAEAAKTSGSGSGSGTYVPGSNPAVDAWVTNIHNGTAKLTDVPANLKNAVSIGLSSTGGGSDAQNNIILQTKEAIDKLQTMSGQSGFLNGAVGFSLSKAILGKPITGTSGADFTDQLNRVKDLLALPNLNLLKGVGRITEKELGVLQSALSSLNTNMTPAEFNTELGRIKTIFDDKASNINSSNGVDLSQYHSTSNGVDLSKFNK